MTLLAIDPGSEHSALVLYDPAEGRVLDAKKLDNLKALHDVRHLHSLAETLAIELTKPFAIRMAKGGSMFPLELLWTTLWVGRFAEAWEQASGRAARLVDRRDVKLHLLGRANGGDPDVRAALIDRFGGTREKAIGKKAAPGPLYGVSGDMWAALGVAVVFADKAARESAA